MTVTHLVGSEQRIYRTMGMGASRRRAGRKSIVLKLGMAARGYMLMIWNDCALR
jgi:hypothetical protein